MSQPQAIARDEDEGLLEAVPKGSSLTRDDRVRMEGAHAARCGYVSHDNPYRPRSADGVSWRAGFEGERPS